MPAPPLRLDGARDTRFVSVDCGALDNGAAARLLPGYAPAPLALRLRETVAWWLEEQRLAFELGEEGEVGGVGEAGEAGEVGEAGEEAGSRADAEHKPSGGAKRSWSPAAAALSVTETVGAEPEGFRFDFTGPADGV